MPGHFGIRVIEADKDKLVGERGHRLLEGAAEEVGLAAPVPQGGQAGHADRGAHGAEPVGPAEPIP